MLTIYTWESGAWVDRTAKLLDGSLKFTNTLTRRDTLECAFFTSDTWSIIKGQRVKLTDDVDGLQFIGRVFARTIKRTGGQFTTYAVTCSSQERVATERFTGYCYFENQKAGDIIKSLNTTGLSDEGFTTTGVTDGPVIPFIEFDRATSVAAAYDKICAACPGYYWYIQDSDIKFHVYTAVAAPFSITESDADVEVEVNETDEGVFNKVTVLEDETGEQVTTAQNDTHIDARSALSGGTGYIEAAISVAKDGQDPTAAATAFLNEHARDSQLPSITIRKIGLKAGQLVAVELPSFSIDASYLIETVTLVDEGNNKYGWQVKLTDGSTAPEWLAAIRGASQDMVLPGSNAYNAAFQLEVLE